MRYGQVDRIFFFATARAELLRFAARVIVRSVWAAPRGAVEPPTEEWQ